MAVKFGSLKTDLDREKDGDWVDVPDLPGVRLKVRGLQYGPYVMARDQTAQRLARQNKGKAVPADERDAAFGALYAKHLLLEWDGFTDDDGKPYDYTPARAMEALTDPAMRDLRNAVLFASSQVSQAEVEVVAEVGEPSAPASSGT